MTDQELRDESDKIRRLPNDNYANHVIGITNITNIGSNIFHDDDN